VNDVVVVATGPSSVVTSNFHWDNVPPSPDVSSETVRVQVPFGSSPMNAPRASSGVKVAFAVPLAYRVSVTVLLLELPDSVIGAGLPGSASSSQRVPLKTSSLVPPLSLVIVTDVPAGEVNVMSRWLLEECVSAVVRSRSWR
jgi:hypothetical protein